MKYQSQFLGKVIKMSSVCRLLTLVQGVVKIKIHTKRLKDDLVLVNCFFFFFFFFFNAVVCSVRQVCSL